jgi:hypothetical protein
MLNVLLALLLQDPAPKPDPFVEKVAETVRARIAALAAQAAGPKSKLDEATTRAASLDDAILEETAKKLGITPAEVRDAWKKRERKPRKVGYGDGSWIPMGGQDGGLDSSVKGTPTSNDTLIPPGPSILTKRKPPPAPEPVPLGKPLKTKDEWWTTASSAERTAYVEAEWARKSGLTEKKEESTRKCPTCSGKGSVNVNRGGIGLTVVCARCHGVKEDLTVQYE